MNDLTTERVPDGIKFTKTHEDGTASSAVLFTFTTEEIDRLRACLPASYRRLRTEKMRKTWHGRLRLWVAGLFRDRDAKGTNEVSGPKDGSEADPVAA